jgi:hypothetical protein
MKKYAFALLFFLVLSCGCSGAWASGKEAVTPPVGSALRCAILAPLRSYLRENLQVEAVFVVRWLKVKDGWAWIETDPQSKDGKARYEPFHALLKRGDTVWAILEIPPMEEDSPPVDGAYFRRLVEMHPGLPPEIFHWEK